jgi:hypothetical protein
LIEKADRQHNDNLFARLVDVVYKAASFHSVSGRTTLYSGVPKFIVKPGVVKQETRYGERRQEK